MKSGDEGFVRGELAMQDLHGEIAIDAALKRPIHAAHGTDAHELANLDVLEDLSSEVRIACALAGRRSSRCREGRAVDRAKERIGRVTRLARRARLGSHLVCSLCPLALGAHRPMLLRGADPSRPVLPPGTGIA
jgi:hypothetical protein